MKSTRPDLDVEIRRFYGQGLRARAIARALGVSVGTVAGRCHRLGLGKAAPADEDAPKVDGRKVKTARQRRLASERLKRLWQDSEFRRRHSEQKSRLMRALNGDPAFQAKAREGQIRFRADPEYRRAQSARLSAYYADPARRAELSERMRRLLADPVRRARAIENALKGNVARCGTFTCPPELKSLYHKLKAALGLEAAREEIRQEIARAVRFDFAPHQVAAPSSIHSLVAEPPCQAFSRGSFESRNAGLPGSSRCPDALRLHEEA